MSPTTYIFTQILKIAIFPPRLQTSPRESGTTQRRTGKPSPAHSIADGVTMTLKDASIKGVCNSFHAWAGLTCKGDATIVLEGTDTVKGFDSNYPGIHVTEGKTLTSNGSGSLTASSNIFFGAAGIGTGNYLPCGNIVVETNNSSNWRRRRSRHRQR